MRFVEHHVIQEALNTWYQIHGTYCSYPDICHNIVTEGKIPLPSDFSFAFSYAKDPGEFAEILSHKPCELLDESIRDLPEITENSFHGRFDINVLFLFFNISDKSHLHEFFQIIYVYKGTCQVTIETETRSLKEGDLFIVAPGTQISQRMKNQDDIVILITIRKSTFQDIFFRLLTQENPLAGFFRMVLYGSHQSHSLLFATGKSAAVHQIIQSITLHSMIEDGYTNELLIDHISILFSELLRNHAESIQSFAERKSAQIPQILSYIRHHYPQLSLEKLADIFHYNNAYLSVLLKKTTGYTYGEIVNNYRMRDAKNYLAFSTKSISEIAGLTGFQSPDAFTKSFQKQCGTAPSQYRKQRGYQK